MGIYNIAIYYCLFTLTTIGKIVCTNRIIAQILFSWPFIEQVH